MQLNLNCARKIFSLRHGVDHFFLPAFIPFESDCIICFARKNHFPNPCFRNVEHQASSSHKFFTPKGLNATEITEELEHVYAKYVYVVLFEEGGGIKDIFYRMTFPLLFKKIIAMVIMNNIGGQMTFFS